MKRPPINLDEATLRWVLETIEREVAINTDAAVVAEGQGSPRVAAIRRAMADSQQLIVNSLTRSAAMERRIFAEHRDLERLKRRNQP